MLVSNIEQRIEKIEEIFVSQGNKINEFSNKV